MDIKKILIIIRRILFFNARQYNEGEMLAKSRDVSRYLKVLLFAGIICILMSALFFGSRIYLMLLVVLATNLLVEGLFSRIRKREFSGGTFIYSMLFVLMIPVKTPLWMVSAGAVFGTIFGKEIFGGTGYNIFSPVLVSRGFLLFSYPLIVKGACFASMLGTSVPGGSKNGLIIASFFILLIGVTLIIIKPSNGLIYLSIIITAVLIAIYIKKMGYLPYKNVLMLFLADGFLFSIIVLAVEPSTCPVNIFARILYGIVIGIVAIIMRCFSNYPESIIPAVLFGNIVAPALDMIFIKESTKHEK